MRIYISVAVATVMAFAGAQNAFAEAEAGQAYFSVMGSYIDDDTERGLEDDLNGGQFSLGYALSRSINIEALISAAIPKSDSSGLTDQEHSGIGIDLQRVFRRDDRFSPCPHAGTD